MIVRSFLKWFENAQACERMDAARHMARAYLDDCLGSDTREEAEAALTLVLDDPSPSVRKALAWEFAAVETAPRHIVVALAHDVSEVSAPVLARSPLLRDPDLVDCCGVGDSLAHMAIALRQTLNRSVSAALAETADSEPLIALLRNPGAEIAPVSFARMLERHTGDGMLREALGARTDLPSPVRHSLLASLSSDLLGFVDRTGWMAKGRALRMVSETRDAATVALAAEADDLDMLVEHLRVTGQLTPVLLLRSLLSGETSLFGAATAVLSGIDPARVARIVEGKGHSAQSALYRKAGLPSGLYPAFEAALAAIRDGLVPARTGEPRLCRPVIQRALAASLEQSEDEMRTLLALLRRFDAEAAREDARALTTSMMTTIDPAFLDSDGRVDMALLARAIEADFDRPYRADELAGTQPVEIDLNAFASDLILEDDQLFGSLAPEPALESFEALSFDAPITAPIVEAPEILADPVIAQDIEAESQGTIVQPINEMRALEADVAELQNLIAEAIAAIPDTSDEDLVALRVVETPKDPLDELFFAGLELRRHAA